MGMPSGDSPAKAQAYYHYLNAHQLSMQRPATWEVRWVDLAWLWGFAIALSVILLLWVWQYRSTRQKANIYPVDSFGGYTTELAGPATAFFLILTVLLTGVRGRADRGPHRLGAEVLMEASLQSPSALPYVAWSSSSVAVIPAEQWPLVFGSMQALKGHVQEYPGLPEARGLRRPHRQ